MMYIGAAYYPELWDEAEVEKDIERCHAYGINCLRIGEFAWGKMEPQEGVFELDWLERVVDRLYQAGIYSLLCTPSATPPRWMLNRYPELRAVERNGGVREAVSSRCHPCKSSPLMRQKNREIVTALAQRFGKHPGVIGWQIDNELYPQHDGCHCPLCAKNFQAYLKEKYETVEQLNRSWGMSRWSLDYSGFDEIEPPERPQWKHPSLWNEWRRFQCELIYTYVDEQAEVLHQYSSAPVGTDLMPNNIVGVYRICKNLDVVQFNHYDRAENLYKTAALYDFRRPVKEHPFWVTETQVGWNGSASSSNGYRPVGNCYANTWLPIALGAEMNLYWLFRAHPNGHELAHGAVFSSCGRPYRVSEEVRRAAEDINTCRDFLENSRISAEIAIHYSSIAEHMFRAVPMLKDLSNQAIDYRQVIEEQFHDAFAHYNVDMIDTPHALDGYRVLFSPFLSHIDKETRERIEQWVNAGGTWIVGPMSDIMTDYAAKATNAPFFFLEELAGVYTRYQKPIANEVFTASWSDGTPLSISGCYDAFEPTDSQSLATYDAGEFGGFSVVTERSVGKGKVILLGSIPSHADLRRLAGFDPIAPASENVRVVRRSGARNGLIALELAGQSGAVTLDGVYTDLISGEKKAGEVTLKPYEVLVLEQQ